MEQKEQKAAPQQQDLAANQYYKFNPELHKKITAYLQTRPFKEADSFLTNVFEADYASTYVTNEGIQNIINYIISCPREEVKMLVAEIQKENAIMQYNIKNPIPSQAPGGEKKAEQASDIAAPAEGTNVSDIPGEPQSKTIPLGKTAEGENASDVAQPNVEEIL